MKSNYDPNRLQLSDIVLSKLSKYKLFPHYKTLKKYASASTSLRLNEHLTIIC